MGLRTELLFALSRWCASAPDHRTATKDGYAAWRSASLARSWASFSDADIAGKDVLDFGCGDGELGLHLARTKRPRCLVGVDLNPAAIERAKAGIAASLSPGVEIRFELGLPGALPVAKASFDTLLAFDCLEHVMEPGAILQDWRRVLRPGGKVLIEWYPYKGPWGPHMESLIPVPWAHVLFGEESMFRVAERLYDQPGFEPRHWDLDEQGRKRDNKWRAWRSFKEQGYINQLDLAGFRALSRASGFRISRLERKSFSGSYLRRTVGHALMALPWVGEYFVSHVVVELTESAPEGAIA